MCGVRKALSRSHTHTKHARGERMARRRDAHRLSGKLVRRVLNGETLNAAAVAALLARAFVWGLNARTIDAFERICAHAQG